MNTEETTPTPDTGPSPTLVWRQLLRTTEGYILLFGIALSLAGLFLAGFVAYQSPQTSEMMGAMSIANLIFGTVVSMSIGYAAGYGHALVIAVNMWVETVVVLLFYPIFVLSMRKLVVFPRLNGLIERTHASAERHQDKVRRYGIAGLFIFVWIPFWMTGPVVGSVIGYLLGFPAWLTLSVVIAGNLMTLIGWAYLLFGLYSHVADFGPWAPIFIIALVSLVIAVFYFLDRRAKKNRSRAQDRR